MVDNGGGQQPKDKKYKKESTNKTDRTRRTKKTTRTRIRRFLFGSLASLGLSAASSSSSSSSSYSYYKSYDPPPSIALSVCSDSVVTVQYLTVLCDSPYTFYYGNGANRHSIRCDYGDKATLITIINVLDDLQDKDTEIFVTMAAYDDANNFLASTYPERLCQDYVAEDCTRAGTYTFVRKLKFGNSYGNQTKFIPVIQMAFSTQSDSGYNLGAVNMDCPQWENEDEPGFVSWSQEAVRSPVQEYIADYGMLVFACCAILTLTWFLNRKARDNPGFDKFPPYIRHSSTGEVSFMEL
jgi:hypothetical protein